MKLCLKILYSAHIKTPKGFELIGIPSPVMSVLLDFSPMAAKHPHPQITEFRPEILPIDRSNGP